MTGTADPAMIARWTLVVVTALVVQIAVAAQFPVAGTVLDFMVLVAICAAVVGGPQRGAIVGFACGLLYDLARDGRLGLSALAFSLVAFLVGMLLVSVLDIRRGLVALIVALGSAAGELTYALLGEVFGEHTLTHPRLWPIIGTIAVVNGVLAIPAIKISEWAEGPQEQPSTMMGAVDG